MCPYNDCGWCYVPVDKESNDQNGMCLNPKDCVQYPPIKDYMEKGED